MGLFAQTGILESKLGVVEGIATDTIKTTATIDNIYSLIAFLTLIGVIGFTVFSAMSWLKTKNMMKQIEPNGRQVKRNDKRTLQDKMDDIEDNVKFNRRHVSELETKIDRLLERTKPINTPQLQQKPNPMLVPPSQANSQQDLVQ